MNEAMQKSLGTVLNEQSVQIFETGGNAFYSSLENKTVKEKAMTLKAMADPTYKASDLASPSLMLVKDVVAHTVEVNDSATGMKKTAYRVVLILKNGETVASVSEGFRQSLTTVFAIFGKPADWDKEFDDGVIPLVVTKVQAKNGKTYNLEVFADDVKKFKGQIVGK